ncbi:hypothetical protein L1O03_00655 [Corynebacterium uropygiale]|uniref:Secreted protein n=1 Tax=Corynebacterium uropygiale TaxID=1775911 RepID=A0A9X1U6H2_9CORY|nr:hypothetical protein [Corynebacterium uropygiale]MCF4005692.1 hypothetical protein [Corynebacterium uropygiale]
MKRRKRRTILAAVGCSVLLGGALNNWSDQAEPPAQPEPQAAEAPAAEGSVDDEYVRVCYNPETKERVEDEQCPHEEGDGDGGDTVVNNNNSGGSPLTPLLWYYIGRMSARGTGPIIPAVGSQVADNMGSTQKPKNGTIVRNVSRDQRSFADSYRSSKDVSYTGDGKTTRSKSEAENHRSEALKKNSGSSNAGKNQDAVKKSGGFGKSGASRGGHGG